MRVCWFRVIADLEQRGVTLRSQADTAGVSLGTIYYWKQGGEPKYRNGELLLDLYANTLGVEPPRITAATTARRVTFDTPAVFQVTASSTGM